MIRPARHGQPFIQEKLQRILLMRPYAQPPALRIEEEEADRFTGALTAVNRVRMMRRYQAVVGDDEPEAAPPVTMGPSGLPAITPASGTNNDILYAALRGRSRAGHQFVGTRR